MQYQHREFDSNQRRSNDDFWKGLKVTRPYEKSGLSHPGPFSELPGFEDSEKKYVSQLAELAALIRRCCEITFRKGGIESILSLAAGKSWDIHAREHVFVSPVINGEPNALVHSTARLQGYDFHSVHILGDTASETLRVRCGVDRQANEFQLEIAHLDSELSMSIETNRNRKEFRYDRTTIQDTIDAIREKCRPLVTLVESNVAIPEIENWWNLFYDGPTVDMPHTKIQQVDRRSYGYAK